MKTYSKTFVIQAEESAEKEALERLKIQIVHTDFVERYWKKQIEAEKIEIKNDIRKILNSFHTEKVFNEYFVTDLVKELENFLTNTTNLKEA